MLTLCFLVFGGKVTGKNETGVGREKGLEREKERENMNMYVSFEHSGTVS